MAESSSNGTSSTIVSAGVVSFIKRENEKPRYAFQIEVQWSDGSKTCCCRSYQQFFEFHCKLLDSFPKEAGTVENSIRTIPFLPGKKLFRPSTEGLAQQRLPQLDQYIKGVLPLPNTITNCMLVKKFLKDDTDNNLVIANNETIEELTKSIEGVKISNDAVSYSQQPVTDETTIIDIHTEAETNTNTTTNGNNLLSTVSSLSEEEIKIDEQPETNEQEILTEVADSDHNDSVTTSD